jgi:uncharacterized membrane protein YedE/YeeE
MDALQLASTTLWVLILAFILSTVFGAVLHATHFCTLGAISDVVLMQDPTRLRQWALAAAVSMLGFAAMHLAGWIDPLQTIYASNKMLWLSALAGGLCFGVGMVLASGCASKALVRLGSGNLKSLVVLLVMGVFALATLRGLLGVVRVYTLQTVFLDAHSQAFVGSWLAHESGRSVPVASAVAAICISGGLLFWTFKDRQFWRAHNLLAGLGVGFLITCMWWVSGVWGHGLEHPETLEAFFVATASGRMESFSFTSPVALVLDAFMYFSDGSKRLSIGMVSVMGVIVGAHVHAVATRTFRWEGFTHRQDVVRHVMGGALMGFGGVTALGCTIGQGLSGLSTLSWMSFVTVASIALGAWTTLAWQLKRMDMSA